MRVNTDWRQMLNPCIIYLYLSSLLPDGKEALFRYNARNVDNFSLATSQSDKKAPNESYLSHHPQPNQESNLDEVRTLAQFRSSVAKPIRLDHLTAM